MNDYPNRPLIGVGVIVLKDESVLLVRRGKPPEEGRWSLPGGRQRLGEPVRETARREVREEAGVEVDALALLDVVDSLHRDDAGGVEYHYTLIDFVAAWRSGDAAAGGDAADVTWAALDDLARYDLWSETLRVIGLARRRRDALALEQAAP